jgi:hypothetical protein
MKVHFSSFITHPLSLFFSLAFLVGFAENSYGSMNSRMRGRSECVGAREAGKLQNL